MSHARSVKLVSKLNALGPEPLVETKSGGEAGGGSRVTPVGQEALEYYDALDRALQEAAAPYLAELVKAISHD
jgi:molybdate transport system regulatory protein